MSEFDYRIALQKNVTVVTFRGKISKDAKEKLEALRKELIPSVSKSVILHFVDVPAVDPIIFRELTMLQHDIRQRQLGLYLVGLDSRVREYLLEKAIIRVNELKKKITDVIPE